MAKNYILNQITKDLIGALEELNPYLLESDSNYRDLLQEILDQSGNYSKNDIRKRLTILVNKIDLKSKIPVDHNYNTEAIAAIEDGALVKAFNLMETTSTSGGLRLTELHDRFLSSPNNQSNSTFRELMIIFVWLYTSKKSYNDNQSLEKTLRESDRTSNAPENLIADLESFKSDIRMKLEEENGLKNVLEKLSKHLDKRSVLFNEFSFVKKRYLDSRSDKTLKYSELKEIGDHLKKEIKKILGKMKNDDFNK